MYTLASFHLLGTMPVLRNLLKRALNSPDISLDISIRIRAGVEPGLDIFTTSKLTTILSIFSHPNLVCQSDHHNVYLYLEIGFFSDTVSLRIRCHHHRLIRLAKFQKMQGYEMQ